MRLDFATLRQWGGNTLLFFFILVVMLDPTNTILGIKDKVFILLVGYNMVCFRPSLRFLPHIMLVFAAVALGYVTGTVQGNGTDMDEVLATCKAFAPLILLLWVHHYDYVRVSLVPALLTALVVLGIYICCAYDERLEGAIYLYMKQHDYTVRMTHRYLLGFKVFGIYYKSLVALAFPMYWFLHRFYRSSWRGRLWWVWPTGLAAFAYLVCGTRATMMLPFFLFALVSYKSIARLRQWRYVFYPALAVFALAFVGLIVVMAAEKTEASNMIKYGHLVSYKQLFEQNPHYMLVGQGVGTRFYSQGFHRLTLTTEWTYIELLRQYGLFCLPILFTLFYPFYVWWQRRRDGYIFGAMGTYLAYFLIAGTNPLLVSSTGIIVVLCAYSLLCASERERVRHPDL